MLLFGCSVMSASFFTPWTLTHQAPLSIGFPRQEYRIGGAISFSRKFSKPRYGTYVSCIGNWVLYHQATREALWIFNTRKHFFSRYNQMVLAQFWILYRDNLKVIFFFHLILKSPMPSFCLQKIMSLTLKTEMPITKKFSRFQNIFLYCIIEFLRLGLE